MDFNLDTFVEQYVAALKAEDNPTIASLIASLEGDDQRNEALSAVIASIKTDEALIAKLGDELGVLEKYKEYNDAVVEATAAAPVKEEA